MMPALGDAVAANLQPILPNTTVAERRRRSLLTLRSYAYDTIDFLLSLHASPDASRHLFDLPEQSGEIFRRVLAEGRGGIVVTGHYANWEIGGVLMRRVLDLPLTVLAMPEADPEVQRMRNQTRDMMGIETLEVRQSMATALKIREKLARNRIVAMLVDRHVGRDRVEVTFFGRQVWFLHSPALIAYLTGAPLMPCFLERVGAGAFTTVAVNPIYVSRELPRDEAIQDAMQRVAAALEARIRAKPHLWYAFYPYWEASAVTAS
jgi:KDO2-lipid IV(A) lauroyltransferase